MRHPDRFTHTRALVRDRASQFVNDFDEIFRSEGLKILRTPVRVPVANAFAERWIGTLRRELLDRTIIWNQHQLQRLAIDYIAHYNMPPAPPLARPATTPTHHPRQQHDRPPAAPSTRPNDPLRWPHQRIQTCRLTSPDRVSGTHRPPVGRISRPPTAQWLDTRRRDAFIAMYQRCLAGTEFDYYGCEV